MIYTQDWFTNKDTDKIWDRVLPIEWRDKPIKALEIGCFEGRSSVWLLTNRLHIRTLNCM